jgi:hypothetical protein
MSLAFNMNGEPFELPANAAGWRVRRMKLKGAPELVYGGDGIPLVVPIDAEVDDLRREVGGLAGRYRLDPVDEDRRPLVESPVGYVYVHADTRASEAPRAAGEMTSEGLVAEAMRMNTEMARSVIDKFPLMMEAAAVLLRAADGAGLPARPGMAGDPAVEEGEDQPAGIDLNAVVAQLVPMLVTGFMGRGGSSKLPSVAEMLDWRKAAPKRAKAITASSERVETEVDGIEPMVPPMEPATMAHFLAVRSQLTPEESRLASEVAKELSPAELRAWFDELGALSVPDAVAKVRALLASLQKRGGRS